MVVEDLLGDICFEFLFWIALHVVYEIAVQILMGFGLSRMEAEGSALAFVFVVIFPVSYTHLTLPTKRIV